jgi:hypothetical protein
VYHCIYEQKIRRAPALVGSILLKLNGREQQVVAEPLVHGSVDILDNPYAARILYISDDEVLPDIVYDPSQGYVAGIDYTLELGDSGESQIVWADAGKQPDIGSTVYVTYTYRALITGGNLRLKE